MFIASCITITSKISTINRYSCNRLEIQTSAVSEALHQQKGSSFPSITIKSIYVYITSILTILIYFKVSAFNCNYSKTKNDSVCCPSYLLLISPRYINIRSTSISKPDLHLYHAFHDVLSQQHHCVQFPSRYHLEGYRVRDRRREDRFLRGRVVWFL